jgi:lysophospholipase L1-like esterase
MKTSRWRFVFFFLLLAAAHVSRAAGASGAPQVLRANAPEISYEGRVVVTSAGAVRMAFPGVTIRLHWRGRMLGLRANAASDTVLFDLRIDGGAVRRLQLAKGESEIELLAGAAAGEHDIELTRRTESWMGVCDVLAFTTDADGTWLAPRPPPSRKLLFIGDSFTCGAATEVRPGEPMERKELRQNARLSYGKLLAERLGAQVHLVACGGRGMLRDWQGIRQIRNPAEYYECALPDDVGARWDFAAYVPDAIGVCLCTNDFDEGIPDQTEFVRVYAEFVRKLRHDAPHASIFLIESPILQDMADQVPKRAVARAYLREVIRRVADPAVHLAPISAYPTVPNDGHPDGAAHRAVADELEPLLRRTLGWQ